MAAEEGKRGIWTPSNIITMVRILLVPVFVAVLLAPWPQWFGLDLVLHESLKRFIAAIVFVFISGTDWLDGYLARSRGEVTDFGKFMDPLADKILVAAALISLVELDALPTWVVLIILAREFIVSGVRMMAASKGVVIAASMLGKFKTVFQMAAIVLFVIKDSHADDSIQAAIRDPLWDISWIVMAIALALTVISLVDYLVKARPLFGLGNPAAAGGQQEPLPPVDGALLGSLADAVVGRALETGATVAAAESLTGGMIGEALTRIPGSSAAFKGGIVSYTNGAKEHLLGVPRAVLDGEGAVSRSCALAMADGARRALDARVAVAVTGIAGPGGAEPGKPVGTVWAAIATADGSRAERFCFEGSREEVRLQTAARALEMVLAEL